MASMNKVILMGRLGRDVELRHIASGSAVCELAVATERVWRDKDGEMIKETYWGNVIAWGKMAENCANYLKKGSQVCIEGYLKTESWDDKTTGEKRSKDKIVAEKVIFLDKPDDRDRGQDRREPARQSGGQTRGRASGWGGGTREPARNSPPPKRQASPPREPDPDPDHDNMDADEDIPF